MGFKKIIILVFILISFHPQRSIAQRIQKLITNFIDTNNLYTSQNVQFNGYYEGYHMQKLGNYNAKTKLYDYNHEKLDSVFWQFILYPNGLCVLSYNFTNVFALGWSRKECLEKTEYFLLQVDKNKEANDVFFKHSRWGLYSIIRDTLKIQSIVNGNNQFGTFNYNEMYFKIEDKNKLFFIESRYIKNQNDVRFKDKEQVVFNFKSFDNIPPSKQSWLYKKKWAHYKK